MSDMYCPKYSRVAYAKDGKYQAVCVRLRCKKWDCDYCAKKNASIWRAHLLKRLPEVSKEWWILTLTAPPWARSASESIKSIRKAVDSFFKRCKRVFGPKIDYVRIYEKHPTSQAIHSHFIVSGFTPYVVSGCSIKLQPMWIGILGRTGRTGVWSLKTWVKKTCQELKMGRIADVQKIEGSTDAPVLYVMKYATKAQQDLKIKGLRHIQATTRIGGPKNESNPKWSTGPYITPDTFGMTMRVIDIGTGEIIDERYWKEHTFWPDDYLDGSLS